MHTEFGSEKLKEKHHFGDVGIAGRIILNGF
jgi:hypothetical protein